MDLAYYANLAEIFGTVAIVVSLVYVAVQIRQNTRTTRLATGQNISRDLREANAIVASDANMAEILLKGVENEVELTRAERLRLYFYLNLAYRVYENAYYQRQEGALDAYVWEGILGNMKFGKRASVYQAFWRDRKHVFSRGFQDFYDNEVAVSEIDPLDAYGSAERRE